MSRRRAPEPRAAQRAASEELGASAAERSRNAAPFACNEARGAARCSAWLRFLDEVRGRELFPLPVVLLAFPTLTVVFAAVGFLMGAGMRGAWALAGFCCAAVLALIGGGSWRTGLRRSAWFVAAVAAIFALDGLFVCFSWWDAQAYHLPAARLLAEGWNPVFAATRQAMLAATGADAQCFNAYHVAYLPRAGWMWSAAVALLTGNSEAGDTLILLSAVALCGLSWRVTPLLFGAGRWKRLFFASLTLLSPGLTASVFCGAQDGTQYALLMIVLLAGCAYRKTARTSYLSYLALAPILGCNLKFTGMLSLVFSAALFTVPVGLRALREKRSHTLGKWICALSAGFGLALAVGFSPYLTNWANHGGPLYPEHSFSKREPLPAMTADFDLQNDDAAAMGYCGRLVNAYLSKWLAHRYYAWKLQRHPFRPVFHLDQVGGLGTGFRIVMCLTLLTLLFTRRCTVPWLLAAVVLTSFLQPTKTMGYVRYVPQLWMLPLLVCFNAITVNVPRSPWCGRLLGTVVMAIMASSSYLFAAGKFFMSLGMSVYALSMVEAMQREAHPRVYALSLHDRYREDGRCLAAWETLPRDIPAPHVFDFYYRVMLPECGVAHPDWQRPEQMRALRAAGTPCFYLGENLWYWPQDPTQIRLPGMHDYAGQPRKPFTAGNVLGVAARTLPELPGHVVRLARLRWAQGCAAWRGGSAYAPGAYPRAAEEARTGGGA